MTTADQPATEIGTDAERDAKRIKVRLFRLRNKLKEKAGVGRSAPGETTIAAEALEKALTEMKKSQEDYPDWVRATLTELVVDLNIAREGGEEERRKSFRHVGALAHELKGQGGTFGYPLTSVFGKSLNEFTERETTVTDNHLEIVKAHIDVMRAVIKDRVSGDGGDVGRELIMVLERAIKKYIALTPPRPTAQSNKIPLNATFTRPTKK
jgi:hypothetical protein